MELKKKNEIERFGFEQDPNLNVAISIQNISKVFIFNLKNDNKSNF